tara:strand:- start:39 stop:434 length:396 start_codon:yes stop_codon:yes gene_type:complete
MILLIRNALILSAVFFLSSCTTKWEKASIENGIENLKYAHLYTPEMSNFEASKYIANNLISDPQNNRFRVKFDLPKSLSYEDWLYHITHQHISQKFVQSSSNPLEWISNHISIRYSLHQEKYIFTQHCYTC